MSTLDTRVQLFGEWVEFPICVAPTAMQKLAHPEGEAATARGAFTLAFGCIKLIACFMDRLFDPGQQEIYESYEKSSG